MNDFDNQKQLLINEINKNNIYIEDVKTFGLSKNYPTDVIDTVYAELEPIKCPKNIRIPLQFAVHRYFEKLKKEKKKQEKF